MSTGGCRGGRTVTVMAGAAFPPL
uniref:Uncharacterized protein n=1 Tax=Arundo donax TaxID=35708 RepID=A0A0A8Y6E2_ARUDO